MKLLITLLVLTAGILMSLFAEPLDNVSVHKNIASGTQSTSQPKYYQIIISFDEPVSYYNDTEFLKQITLKIHQNIFYVSSINDYSHVYKIESANKLNIKNTLESLRKIKNVKWVELDQTMKHL